MQWVYVILPVPMCDEPRDPGYPLPVEKRRARGRNGALQPADARPCLLKGAR